MMIYSILKAFSAMKNGVVCRDKTYAEIKKSFVKSEWQKLKNSFRQLTQPYRGRLLTRHNDSYS